MTTGPRITQRSSTAPSPTLTRPLEHGALAGLGLEHGLEAVEDQAVGLEHVLELAGVLPPAGDHVRLHAQAAVDQVLDGVGDLELAPRRGLDAP